MDIAQGIGGEIIGADSRQVYRHMDIGTAKPPVEDLRRVHHHLIDIIDPSEEYSVALYVRQAREAIEDVQRTRQRPHRGGWDRAVCLGLTGGMERAGGLARPFAQSASSKSA